ncbi:ATP-grasp domain-containing protein [Streptomyces sp. NPDC048604]|uniref:ATP-grasp domain-containing protein n=1 Tax=Streptomyces sp. NPDC048604 TaxID=3365578 RepID=UPI00370F7ED9
MNHAPVPPIAPVLATTPHASPTRELLTRAAEARRMEVIPLTTRRAARQLGARRERIHFYGGPALGEAVAEDLSVTLLEPKDDWLPNLPREFTHRTLEELPLAEARKLDTRVFAKPPRDKTFPARIYADGRDLPTQLAPTTKVLVSEVVDWSVEFRLFVLDGEIRTGSQYARHGLLDVAPLMAHHQEPEARRFATTLLERHGETLPSAVVLDIGVTAGEWAVVEANMPWFSTLYAADPSRALDVVLRSATPTGQLQPRDRQFSRTQPEAPATRVAEMAVG